ncbi:MAG: hypothetical protein U0234_12490 [Sandaracinus sp.]
MHPVIRAYLRVFADEHGLKQLGEAEQFERFVNHCVVAQFTSEQVDLERITTSDADPSIDGIVTLLGDDVVYTAQEASDVLKALPARRSISAHYVFVQAKRSDGFDAGEMLKFGIGTKGLFDAGSRTNDDVAEEFVAIHQMLLESLNRIGELPIHRG